MSIKRAADLKKTIGTSGMLGLIIVLTLRPRVGCKSLLGAAETHPTHQAHQNDQKYSCVVSHFASPVTARSGQRRQGAAPYLNAYWLE